MKRPREGATDRAGTSPGNPSSIHVPASSRRAHLDPILLHWILRISVFLCFVGHGAFGIRMKPAWIPYFTALGFDEGIAYRLMPIVGTMDILMGISALLSPCRAVLVWMAFWGAFTACLRPVAGEPLWETLERAGNYGVPLAFLALSGPARSWHGWFQPILPRPVPATDSARIDRAALVLRLTTGLLLIGHGGFGAFMNKSMLADQYASAGLAAAPLPLATLVQGVGWLELLLGVAVLAAPVPALLLFVFFWKIATETLYPISGEPYWEFIERGGSYGAPLALFWIQTRRRSREPAEQAAPVSAEEVVA